MHLKGDILCLNAKMDGIQSKSILEKIQLGNANTIRYMRLLKKKLNGWPLNTKQQVGADLTHLPEQRP